MSSPRPGPSLAEDHPSRSDPFVRSLSERFGGPFGRHGQPGASWWNPTRVALLTATAVYLIGVMFRLPCRMTVAGRVPDVYRNLCYSDISVLYGPRGLLEGNTPYLDSGNYQVLEYPVLSGAFLELTRLITVALGAPTGTGLSDQQRVDATLTFFDVNVVLLGACLLIAVWAQVRSVPHRPWDAMMLAASPCVAASALINWDLFAIALTALGVLFWSRRRPGIAGVLWGLAHGGQAVPVLLLGPLLILCLRSGRLRAYGMMLVGFVISWALVEPAGDDLGAGGVADLLAATTPAAAATSAPSGTCCRWPAARCRTSTWWPWDCSLWGASAIAALIMVARAAAADRRRVLSRPGGLSAHQQGVLAAVHAVAPALRRARSAGLAGCADLHGRRDDLLRRHLVASGRLPRPGQRGCRPDLLVRGDHPDAHPDLDRDHGGARCAPTRARCGPPRRLRRSRPAASSMARPMHPWMRARSRPLRQAQVLRQVERSMGAERGPSVIARDVRPSTGSGRRLRQAQGALARRIPGGPSSRPGWPAGG